MSKEGLLKICKESLEQLKKGEISPEDFYEVYIEHLENQDKEMKRLSQEIETYLIGASYLKNELAKLKSNISEIEANYSNLLEK